MKQVTTQASPLSRIGDVRFTAPPSPRAKPSRRFRRRLFRLVVKLLGLLALVALPFVAFVRVSVYSYSARGLPTWLALTVGLATTIVIVSVYAMVVSKTLTGKARARVMVQRVALPLVLVYCAYGLWYLSSLNAKTSAVRSQYTALHPVLRVALGTVLLVDRQIVLTDVRRLPDSYRSMGLPTPNESLHYEQGDGYVHAVDLRTLGRGEVRNWLIEGYFRTMGFRTLRHVGTADHLHVTLGARGGG